MNTALEQLVIRKTRDALDKVADNPHVAFDTSAVRTATAAVVGSVAPIIAHATNAEPWYRSRVVIGNVIGIILAVMALFGLLSNGVTEYEALSVPIGIILANGFSLYGRLVAAKPLGQ